MDAHRATTTTTEPGTDRSPAGVTQTPRGRTAVPERPPSPGRRLLAPLAVLFLLLGGWIVLVVSTVRLVRRLRPLEGQFADLEARLPTDPAGTVREGIPAAEEAVRLVARRLGNPAWRLAAALPVLGTNVDVARRAVDAVVDLLDGAEPVLLRLVDVAGDALEERVTRRDSRLQLWSDAAPVVDEIVDRVETFRIAVARVCTRGTHSSVREAFTEMRTGLDLAVATASSLVDLAPIARDLATGTARSEWVVDVHGPLDPDLGTGGHDAGEATAPAGPPAPYGLVESLVVTIDGTEVSVVGHTGSPVAPDGAMRRVLVDHLLLDSFLETAQDGEPADASVEEPQVDESQVEDAPVSPDPLGEECAPPTDRAGVLHTLLTIDDLELSEERFAP